MGVGVHVYLLMLFRVRRSACPQALTTYAGEC